MSTPVVTAERVSEALPVLSAEDLHSILLKSHIIGNRVRRRFLVALLALATSRLYLKLGFSSIEQYSEKYFGFERSYTYDMLRVAKALPDLPRSDAAFQNGTLCWSALKEICRVAKTDTEEDWLRFASEHPVSWLKAEVKDALKKNRKKPRKGRHGLPNLPVRCVFELTLAEYDLVTKALKKAAREMSQSQGEDDSEPRKLVDRKDALLHLAREMLSTDPDRRAPRRDPLSTIVYRSCPTCKAAYVQTREGPVEVTPEEVERVEAVAEQVTIPVEEEVAPEEEISPEDNSSEKSEPEEIDPPNTPQLTRRVLLRDGETCANPYCRRVLGLQAHHIRLRSEGGATAPWNETSVCQTCHALVHAGHLSVKLNGNGELVWSRKADELPGAADIASELAGLATELATVPEARSESVRTDLGEDLDTVEDAIAGLRELGFSKSSATQRVSLSAENLRKRGTDVTVEALLQEALSG